MKRLSINQGMILLAAFILSGLALIFAFGGCTPYAGGTYVGAEVDYSSGDYGFLGQYGEWDNYSPFGHVWRPWVDPDWQPFEYGNWEWTSSGWTWVSYEPYGWIVYHYGNWNYEPEIGWFWIPGKAWSPARVQWMYYGDYVCWAPLPPKRVAWGDPWDRNSARYWNVVTLNDFTREDISQYRVHDVRHDNNRVTIIRREPDVKVIERKINQPVPKVKIGIEKDKSTPGQYRRIVLPPDVSARVEKNQPIIEKKVIRKGALQPIPRKPESSQQNKPQNQQKEKKNGRK